MPGDCRNAECSRHLSGQKVSGNGFHSRRNDKTTFLYNLGVR